MDDNQQPDPAGAAEDSPTRPMPTPGAQSAPSAGEGVAPPGIYCWNCGRPNPRSHVYCLQCGAPLAGASTAAAGGQGGRPPHDPRQQGGGRARVAAMATTMLAVLLLAGLGVMMMLGGNLSPLSGSPTPTGAAVASFMPEESAEPSVPASPASSPSAFPETPPPTAEPTASATATASPTSPPTASPTATATATPTAAPTPANCSNLAGATQSAVLDAANLTRQISATRIWCVTGLTFRDGAGDGTLKLYLTNPVFLTDQYGYSSARVGWNEAFMTGGLFGGSATESPEMLPLDPLLDQSRSYRMFPQGTLIEFEISCNTADPCEGTVRLDYNRRQAPPLP